MFGYIKPFKPQLKMCEYDGYKAVYCGLCGELGRSYGPLVRMSLSYDFTFLCMLYYSVTDITPKIKKGRCFVNPLKKHQICQEDDVLKFGADAAMIMLYHKLIDNVADEKPLKAFGCKLVSLLVKSKYKKAAKNNPQCAEIIENLTFNQRKVEERSSGLIDEAAEPTAIALSKICRLITEDEKQQRILERLGYCVGRFVYLCDMMDDLEADIKDKKYNPLIIKYNLLKDATPENIEKALSDAKASVYMTIAEAASGYNLLEAQRFSATVENIVTMGMQMSVEEIFQRKKETVK